MPRIRDILRTLRVAAVGLLMLPAVLGLLGLGEGSALAAISKPCEVSCPCHEPAHDSGAEHHTEHAASMLDCEDDPSGATGVSGSDDSCSGECPDDCPSCGCGVSVAVVGLSMRPCSRPTSRTAPRVFVRVEAPPSGACTGVFRPPRSLT